VIRVLQTDFSISPLRMTASGRAEYAGMSSLDTPEGRVANRRTRVVIQPQLDPLLRLLERKGDADMRTGNKGRGIGVVADSMDQLPVCSGLR